MTNDTKIFTLLPDLNTGEKGEKVTTYGTADLAERKAAAARAGRSYTVSDVPE